jgi:hypothetical protein
VLTTKPGDIAKWHCSQCGKWMPIEKGLCACGSSQGYAADAFRLNNQLAKEEEVFYNYQIPDIIRELRGIRTVLDQIKGAK